MAVVDLVALAQNGRRSGESFVQVGDNCRSSHCATNGSGASERREESGGGGGRLRVGGHGRDIVGGNKQLPMVDVVDDSAVGGEHNFVGDDGGPGHGDIDNGATMVEGVRGGLHSPIAGVAFVKDNVLGGEGSLGLRRVGRAVIHRRRSLLGSVLVLTLLLGESGEHTL